MDFKEWKRKQNQLEQGLSQEGRHFNRTINKKFKNYTKLKAPTKCSFIEDPELFIEFINKLKNQFDKRQKVFVMLQDVEIISYDAIVVLLSIMVKFKAGNIDFNGNFPTNTTAKRILQQSQFIKYLYKEFEEEDRYDLGQESSIHTHAWKHVDSVLSHKLIEQATKTIWGEVRRCQGVQRALIELMLNTNNHADIHKEGEKHWWLSVNHLKAQNKVGFSFVDFGVGVFTSLNNKKPASKFYKVIDKLKRAFNYKDNAELLQLIMSGDLHQTATGKPYHGKGLPGINKVRERNQFTNLHIITNNVYANVGANEYRVLPEPFSGTFVYWELTRKNESCNGLN